MSQAEVAEPLGWSQSKVAHLETATSAVKLNDLDKLLDLFDADKQTREDCRDLANAGRRQLPRRKGLLRNRFEGDIRLVVDMEGSATTVWCHNCMVIPAFCRPRPTCATSFAPSGPRSPEGRSTSTPRTG